MTYNYDPSTGPDLFTTHSEPHAKKNLSDTNCSPLIRLSTPCQQVPWSPLRCVFFGKGTWMVSLSNNVRSVFFLSHSAVNLNMSALQSAGIFQVSKGTYTLPKKQNGPGPKKKVMSFWKARNFQFFNNYKGNFYLYCPSGYTISGVRKQVSSTVLEFFLGPTRWAPTSCKWGEITYK